MSIISEMFDMGAELGSDTVDYSDTAFFVGIAVAAILLVVLFCIIEVAVYNIRLRRAVEFKDKDA